MADRLMMVISLVQNMMEKNIHQRIIRQNLNLILRRRYSAAFMKNSWMKANKRID